MKGLGRAVAVTAGIGLLMAGCAAASHLKVLQPPSVPRSPNLVMAQPAQPRPWIQLGIDVEVYTYPGQDIAAAAAADIGYLRSLHANSVSVSFPFFVTGRSADKVEASSSTPTPAQLGTIVEAAQNAGLYVSVRPLLDETSLRESRVQWQPIDQAAWFRSYRDFLLPYATMAQQDHVQEFIVGAEFSRFSRSSYWNSLDTALRSVYTGTLAFANNWGGDQFTGHGGKGVAETVDAYPPMQPPLLAAWESFDRKLSAGTVETEVGIDAVAGAYKRPWQHEWTAATSLDTSVQADWFTAACHAVEKTHLGGIYFWPLAFSQQLTGPTPADQGLWAHSAGGAAISSCFASLETGSP